MVQFIITGDTGTGEKEQYKVANTMVQLIQKKKDIKSVILLGDNIYETGSLSVDDIQFKEKFEDPYQQINKPFYLCLGNHDYGLSHNPLKKGFMKDNSQVQVDYSKVSNKWNMPSKYYHYEQSPCDFFFLDTNFDALSESTIMKQYHEMIQTIKQSKQKWKILCGHHTWRSVGGHGNAEKRHETFMQDLLKEEGVHIDVYMCGHDHCKNIIETKIGDKKIVILVIGTGAKPYKKEYFFLNNMKIDQKRNQEDYSDLIFHSPNLGVCLLEATQKILTMICYNEQLQEEFEYQIKST